MMAELVHEFGIHIDYSFALRARNIAIEMIYGDTDKSYEQLPAFLHTLRLLNPGTLIDMQITGEDRLEAYVSCAFLEIDDGRWISAEQHAARHSDRSSSCRTVNLTPGCAQSDQSAAESDESKIMPYVPLVHDPTRTHHDSSKCESPSSGPH
ncbi:hypothetical protein C2S52_006735 [Perilla frutescens var. hirtella]|nr:hypothetical protein C2S52_006735 [Perilla frutescens var. hirtella]